MPLHIAQFVTLLKASMTAWMKDAEERRGIRRRTAEAVSRALSDVVEAANDLVEAPGDPSACLRIREAAGTLQREAVILRLYLRDEARSRLEIPARAAYQTARHLPKARFPDALRMLRDDLMEASGRLHLLLEQVVQDDPKVAR